VENFFNERLIVDMLPLAKQVLICCDSARAVVATASLSEPPVLGDDPKTMADLRAHVAKTIVYLQSKLEADFSQYASGHYYPYWAGGKGMDGHSCVHEYGIPNFYFHLTMTYALLRQAGVDLGKRDYLVFCGPGIPGMVPGYSFGISGSTRAASWVRDSCQPR